MKTLLALSVASGLVFPGPSALHAEQFNSAGVKIHYVVAGRGEPVILIHGLYSSARMNWEMPGIASELAKQYRVIALDCRGHGQSDKPEAEGAYGTNMVEDVIQLMDHLHITKARVVGYSMGGMITMKLVVLHPDRVRSAVLGGMGWHKADAPMNKFWEEVNGRGRRNIPVACLHGFPALGVTEPEIKAVTVPVTVIVGDRDPCRRMYVEPLRTIRPDWPVHLINDAGHLNCIMKSYFRKQLKDALKWQASEARQEFQYPAVPAASRSHQRLLPP